MKTSENKIDFQENENFFIRLKPQQFIHVLDNNNGVSRLEVGPQTITLREHERLLLKPQQMIVVPP